MNIKYVHRVYRGMHTHKHRQTGIPFRTEGCIGLLDIAFVIPDTHTVMTAFRQACIGSPAMFHFHFMLVQCQHMFAWRKVSTFAALWHIVSVHFRDHQHQHTQHGTDSFHWTHSTGTGCLLFPPPLDLTKLLLFRWPEQQPQHSQHDSGQHLRDPELWQGVVGLQHNAPCPSSCLCGTAGDS